MSNEGLNPILELVERQNLEINRRIEESFNRTNERMTEMSSAIKELAVSMREQGERHAAFEEKILAQNATIQRLDQNQKEMGIKLDSRMGKQDDKIESIEKDLILNNQMRKAVIWLVGLIISSAIAGGILFA